MLALVFASCSASWYSKVVPPLTVTESWEPLMLALVRFVRTKSTTSPICQPEIVPLSPFGCTKSKVPDEPTKVTPIAVPPDETYSWHR